MCGKKWELAEADDGRHHDELISYDSMPAVPDLQAPGVPTAPKGGSPRCMILSCGLLLLLLVLFVPFYNAIALIRDFNYVFWVGIRVPLGMITAYLTIIVMYVATVLIFFRISQPRVQTEQTIFMIATIFMTLIGLTLIGLSMPLSAQANTTFGNLMYRAEYSPQTLRTWEYAQVLQNIRYLPQCAHRYSVEECEGYEEANPYTGYLKEIEGYYKCTGFGYRHNGTQAKEQGLGPMFPPTIFSDANYQAHCEKMAAHDFKNYAGDIGFQIFYLGVALVLIAIGTGFLKLIGFCVHRPLPEEQHLRGHALQGQLRQHPADKLTKHL
jgi:hypothetical protein